MLTRSRVIGDASAFAGEPADEPLPGGVPMHLRYSMAADMETELIRDMNLSVQNRTMAKTTQRLVNGQREFTLSQPGLEDPVFVSLASEGAVNEIPTGIDITNVVLIDSEARDAKRKVAFYDDKSQKGILSWTPDGTETLTIWYDRSPQTDPNATLATFTITDSYVPLLKLMLAAQMLELMNKPIGAMLTARIAKGLKQWDKFTRSGKQQGVIEKSTYRQGRRRTNREQFSAWPGRVNFE